MVCLGCFVAVALYGAACVQSNLAPQPDCTLPPCASCPQTIKSHPSRRCTTGTVDSSALCIVRRASTLRIDGGGLDCAFHFHSSCGCSHSTARRTWHLAAVASSSIGCVLEQNRAGDTCLLACVHRSLSQQKNQRCVISGNCWHADWYWYCWLQSEQNLCWQRGHCLLARP